MVTLLTKLPELKPPCICLVFDEEKDARMNGDLVYMKDNYQVTFMPLQEDKMCIMVTSAYTQKLYREVKYEANLFYCWLRYTRYDKDFKFVHLLRTEGKLSQVMFSQNKPFSLDVKSHVLKNEFVVV